MKILITGVAGFIGFHLAFKLLQKKNYIVFGIDNLNNYYDLNLKKNRIKILKPKKNFFFKKIDICDEKKIKNLFKKNNFNIVINLAAQAGVRYSIDKPKEYIKSNLVGFFNIINYSQKYNVGHFVFASSSSVYGANNKFPLSEKDNTDQPLSLYAATKKSNEMIAHSFSNIYNLNCTGLRFFTVFGPYGRPDMSYYKFAEAISKNKKILINNHGKHKRDFTYIDDAIAAVSKIINKKPKGKISFEVYNIAKSSSIGLIYFLSVLEKELGKKAKITMGNIKKGDVYKTHGSIEKIKQVINFNPTIDINKGIKRFVLWYKMYNKI